MLNLLLKQSELPDVYKESWNLCFDEQKCVFYVCHSTQYIGNEQEPHVDRFPLSACCDLITEKLKEHGFASDGIDEYKPEQVDRRGIYHAGK